MKDGYQKCKICETPTKIVFNISFEATPICQRCATAITTQEVASWIKDKSP